ncbi:septin and tuftelin-interacting protein 1 homolog 1-like [Rosa rugosa]|uniref:septin and tuftelin-interacting protein 1 homolog 1-like n=1 Tax=Rosa rugosa TaxID=74645 RepID=UPI002B40F2A0|nr:septin and tuftelin-interacting protein 1 homolog 1-like [Rosa rugosa]
MERFGMENDYEDGQWIDGEFFYRKRKERRVQSKDDALYGYSDEEDEEYSDGSRKRRKKDRYVDYTKPIKFVSTEKLDNNSDQKKTDHGTPVIGFNSTGMRDEAEDDDDDDDDDGDGFLATEFGRKIKDGAERRRTKKEKLKFKNEIRKCDGDEGGIGDLEKHTKGIGRKMFEKMGYTGGGLGKNQQGIVSPIEVKLRPKNMGMGFNDYKETETKLQSLLEDKPNKPTTLKQKPSWKKKMRTSKEHYLSAEEFIAKKQEESDSSLFVHNVIDMRGPQVRVLSNLDDLNEREEDTEDEGAFMPELQHNLKLLVDLAELDIMKLDRDLRYEREAVIRLKNEKERQKQHLDSMESIQTVLDQLEEEKSMGTLTLDSLANSFGELKRRYADEYKLCKLSCIACSFALPLFMSTIQGWDALQYPLYGLDFVSSWKALLHGEGNKCSTSSPYAQLVFEIVRISGADNWQAKDPEPMLRFLEAWEKLLPPCVLNDILDHLVLPKLKDAVGVWEPCRDTLPIHVWVHPWLPLMGHRLEELYPTIRFKLGNVLSAWHPSDASAYAILSPWKNVFDSASWKQLMHRFIVPKLQLVLEEFHVNPANQSVDQFNWVMRWAYVIPSHMIADLMVKFFFPKWITVLFYWLKSNPNFEEILHWYKGWKEVIPEELQANESIRLQLNWGLDMMNRAVEGRDLVEPCHVEQRQSDFEAQKKAAATAAANQANSNETMMSLRDVIEAFAQQHSLLFKPKPERRQDGHQIYALGYVNIIVDSVNQKVYARKPREEAWSLVDLATLLDMHNNSLARRR